MLDIGSEFRKWLQDESSLVHSRVRNLQARFADHSISGEQDIDVQNAWTFIASALPSHFCFNGKSVGQHFLRRDVCFQCDDAVKEPGLIAKIHWLGFI